MVGFWQTSRHARDGHIIEKVREGLPCNMGLMPIRFEDPWVPTRLRHASECASQLSCPSGDLIMHILPRGSFRYVFAVGFGNVSTGTEVERNFKPQSHRGHARSPPPVPYTYISVEYYRQEMMRFMQETHFQFHGARRHWVMLVQACAYHQVYIGTYIRVYPA